MNYGVILFYTTSAVMHAEKLLGARGFNIKLIPTSRQFSSDCGIALCFDWNQYEKVKAVLEDASIEFDSMRRM